MRRLGAEADAYAFGMKVTFQWPAGNEVDVDAAPEVLMTLRRELDRRGAYTAVDFLDRIFHGVDSRLVVIGRDEEQRFRDAVVGAQTATGDGNGWAAPLLGA